MFLSVVIPALNEEQSIAVVVNKALNALRVLGIDGEVIVVNNGSEDRTRVIAEQCGARVVDVSAKGYGHALQGGFSCAKGDHIIMADADDSYNLDEIGPYIDKLNDGYDLVMGNRFQGRIHKGAMPFLHRYLGTPVLTFVMNVLFKTSVGDSNCGMRAFKKAAYQKMRCHAPGMEFATEMIINASRSGSKITEVPCNLYPDKRRRRPHLNPWRDGWRHLCLMVRMHGLNG